ncbi:MULTISPECIES: ABC transporter ATP-binding protein [Ensifer]|jgi:peptide/nickel transport system ATP-binding protein|uniref:Dipeptide ABC transporter ATP-binding protein n=1 Tax=Ensifer canadensis TaxID=555315 RepID=A0AAW4FNG9_9HYPH|nr:MULTISPECIES: ABC transporter ATP-binding protein [Ensifer]MDP9631530.1 peptide/nickel transport system ATP-binding protein [Ensifer adhaerens]KQU72616.1 ABC transporter ATP-binding protein [Ensifer sp. Root31]KQY57949.1 ABC transporter ATP-binding protein [Ensifer sp. Root142]MBD9488676.1 ABC transporter ATP-binding protein [Ensifer sp. ENS11]MBM3091940.1 dipeptide ABC transporter ATP-binding protein [Ensifer canadensis]
MTSGADLLRVEGLRITFSVLGGEVEAVKEANFRILPGKVTALVGESGSGKSAISQAVMGILPNVARVGGHVLFNDPAAKGKPIDLLSLEREGEEIRALRGTRISKIFQEPMTSLSPLHTIGNQISEVLKIHTDAEKAERRARTEELLGYVGFSNPKRAYDMYPFELSGGMRQRAMIAMALICRPALLIADEPTTALDVTVQAQILQLLRELQVKLNMAMLLITHDLGVVANMADEVVVIYHGQIVEAGPVDAIFRNPQHPYLKGLMAAVPHFDMKPGERLKALREVPVKAGTLLGAKASTRAVGPDVLLSVRNLSKTYGTRKTSWFGKKDPSRHRAVDDVSFDIRRGECLGLVGESGCGKTTVSKILMRAITPDGGSVSFDDGEGPIDVLKAEGDELKTLRSKIQMVFQDPVSSLSPRMTVRNILSEPLEIHGRGTAKSRVETVRSLLQAVGLDQRFVNRYPHSFSGGQRQRIGIARALALVPQLLICDEPVSALDVSVQAQILNLLKDLQKELGLTCLFISHNLAVVDYMADRIAVMCAGRIVELAPREVLMRKPVHPYTKSLLAAVPYPDLDRPLDFDLLKAIEGSDMRRWGPQFSDDGEEGALFPADLGGDHYVLARKSVDARELRP